MSVSTAAEFTLEITTEILGFRNAILQQFNFIEPGIRLQVVHRYLQKYEYFGMFIWTNVKITPIIDDFVGPAINTDDSMRSRVRFPLRNELYCFGSD